MKTENLFLLRYINRLSDMNETQLVAFYVSKLGKRKQVVLYAKHCEKILTHNDRKNALNYAEQFNLDVYAISTRIVESITNKPSEVDVPGNLQVTPNPRTPLTHVSNFRKN